MIVHNSSDTYEESGLSPLLSEMVIGRAFRDKIDNKIVFRDYGNDTINLFFVVNCLKFDTKKRIRFSKKDNTLYWDVILNYERILKSTEEEKKQILANEIIKSFDVLDKYKKLNLNKELILKDVKKYFEGLEWI